MRCPNCNADLPSRPCAACGWPESTEPSAAERRRVERALEAHQVPDRSGGCGPSCAGLLALVCAVIASGFFRVGQGAHWTSDGPAMLFVYLGVGVFGLAALSFAAAALRGVLLPHLPGWLRRWFEED